MNVKDVGNDEVVLLAGGGQIFTDIAARFTHSNRDLMDIIASPYDAKIVKNIVGSGHGAAMEFDYFIFGISGYARVTEIQLVRKRLASYLIGSGRDNRKGKRSFDVVVPESIKPLNIMYPLDKNKVYTNGVSLQAALKAVLDPITFDRLQLEYEVNYLEILDIIEQWYDAGVVANIPEEDLRYIKPQATEFKAIIGMNAHALMDWFKIRTCMNAQFEIRDLAIKMMRLCKDTAPDLFIEAGPSCKSLGYCPENKLQNAKCKGKVYTKAEALQILKNHKDGGSIIG